MEKRENGTISMTRRCRWKKGKLSLTIKYRPLCVSCRQSGGAAKNELLLSARGS